MKTVLELLRKHTELKVLTSLFLISLSASTVLTVVTILNWLGIGRREVATEESVAAIPIVTSTLTPLPPPTPTPIPRTLTATPTPIADQYDFDGIHFGMVSEFEILNGVNFHRDDLKNVTLRLDLADGQEAEFTFLPIPYFEWMGGYFGTYCPFNSKKGCVFAEDRHVTILVHTGCMKYDPESATAEQLGAYLDNRPLCGYPSVAPEPSHYKTAEGTNGVLTQGNNSLERRVLHVEYIPPERLTEFSQSMAASHLAEQIGRTDLNASGRLIYLITSSRLKGCTPEFSCGRWLLILEGKDKEGQT